MNARSIVLASTLGLVALSTLTIAGPLTPPAGPVQSSFKTLSDIEPRIALSATNTPGDATAMYLITQPGSYYLTGNVTCPPGKKLVMIRASDVTLDLGGFTVRASANQPGEVGVQVGDSDTSFPTEVTIRDGVVAGFTESQVELNDRCLVQRIMTRGGEVGISGSNNCHVTDCSAAGSQTGISLSFGSTVESCTLDGNTVGVSVLGSVVRGCTVMGSNRYGILAYVDSTIVENHLVHNGPGGGAGIYLSESRNTIERNTVTGSYWGILLGPTATRNAVFGNRVMKGNGSAYAMDGQTPGNFPSNSVGQIIANPASPSTTTNDLANIER